MEALCHSKEPRCSLMLKETLNPKPQTLNPKPQTLNPKPAQVLFDVEGRAQDPKDPRHPQQRKALLRFRKGGWRVIGVRSV